MCSLWLGRCPTPLGLDLCPQAQSTWQLPTARTPSSCRTSQSLLRQGRHSRAWRSLALRGDALFRLFCHCFRHLFQEGTWSKKARWYPRKEPNDSVWPQTRTSEIASSNEEVRSGTRSLDTSSSSSSSSSYYSSLWYWSSILPWSISPSHPTHSAQLSSDCTNYKYYFWYFIFYALLWKIVLIFGQCLWLLSILLLH